MTTPSSIRHPASTFQHGRKAVAALVGLVLVAGIAAALGCRPEVESVAPVVADVSGLWRMRETHADFKDTLRETWLEIRQDGDRVEIRAWEDHDSWTCAGKGRVEDRKVHFQWWGPDKRWRGTASLELRGGELMGTFQRLDVEGIGEQYCRGARASSSRLPAPGFRLPASGRTSAR